MSNLTSAKRALKTCGGRFRGGGRRRRRRRRRQTSDAEGIASLLKPKLLSSRALEGLRT
jgi:hypothetical protein